MPWPTFLPRPAALEWTLCTPRNTLGTAFEPPRLQKNPPVKRSSNGWVPKRRREVFPFGAARRTGFRVRVRLPRARFSPSVFFGPFARKTRVRSAQAAAPPVMVRSPLLADRQGPRSLVFPVVMFAGAGAARGRGPALRGRVAMEPTQNKNKKTPDLQVIAPVTAGPAGNVGHRGSRRGGKLWW